VGGGRRARWGRSHGRSELGGVFPRPSIRRGVRALRFRDREEPYRCDAVAPQARAISATADLGRIAIRTGHSAPCGARAAARRKEHSHGASQKLSTFASAARATVHLCSRHANLANTVRARPLAGAPAGAVGRALPSSGSRARLHRRFPGAIEIAPDLRPIVIRTGTPLPANDNRASAPIRKRERLGGMLNYYHRDCA